MILGPILIIVAFCIRKEDKGSAIFKQKRAGLNGVPFWIFKFRSMKIQKQSPDIKENPYQWENKVPEDFIFKATSDLNPNVTSIGRIIRKYSIDEFPQFINVLKGDMSIVGPRPELIEITDCYNRYQKNRLNVKPGITGWAQINGRSEIPHGKKIDFDLYYVKNQSIMLDIKIFFITIYHTIFGKGAI